MGSVIWKLITNCYSEIDDLIRDIDSLFFVGLCFVLLWLFILGIIAGLILLTIHNWIITVWIFGIIVVIELLCWLGRKIKGED